MAPDGRSLVTSVGTRRSAIWIHNAAGEREISSESYAVSPRLSRDGNRVFYLFARDLMLSAQVGWMASVRRIALRGSRLWKDGQRAAGLADSGLRYFARRKGSGLHDKGKQWRIADLAGAPGSAQATSSGRSSRGSGFLRRWRRSRLPIARGERRMDWFGSRRMGENENE